MNYKIFYTKDAAKDFEKVKKSKLYKKVVSLIDIIKINPYQNPPEYEKLLGDLDGAYSRRINKKHRLIYQIFNDKKIVKIISLWSHYEF
ncbi:MAG TPA: Txe/YoeB family addiction module toxin [Spirochaetota bacterium]|nr:MAG: Toxin RelK [Spirochaetes bacterium ADurb.Bin133]HNZ27876.1 Txe/YoeB family addiction module toxin [Spirochaetota bacterium]